MEPALQMLHAKRPLIIGHRGICELAPENTLPSFKLALEAGADLVEMDYHHSQDGVPVVIHDDTLDRTTDARTRWKRRNVAVSGCSAAEIQSLDAGSWFDPKFGGARVPVLSEALDLICGSGSVALVERKSGDAATCVQLLRDRHLINRVVVIAFDWAWLRRFHELEPGQLVGALGCPTHLVDGTRPRRKGKRLSGEWLEAMAETGARVVVWNRRLSKPAVQLAHELGLRVWVYTVNDAELARQLLDVGVDGLITNSVLSIKNALPTGQPDGRQESR